MNLLYIAKEFVNEKFAGCRGILGVLLTGSAAFGVRDELVDLDFEVIVTDEYYEVDRFLADEAKYAGFDVCWSWTPFTILKSKLNGWHDDVNLWVYSTAKIMYDTDNRLKTLLEEYKEYPENIRMEKMFSYFFYGWAEAPYNFEKALHRKDPLTAQFCLSNAVEIFTALLFIINHSFVPYRKWRLHELKKIAKKPLNYEERIKELIQTKNFLQQSFSSKHKIIHDLVNEIREMLIQEGVPTEKIGENMWRYEPKYKPSI